MTLQSCVRAVEGLCDLEVLRLDFNEAIDDMKFPDSLRALHFGDKFDQSLSKVAFPSSLDVLSVGGDFRKSLDGMSLPSGLRSLVLPASLQQQMDNVRRPDGLESLAIVEPMSALDRLSMQRKAVQHSYQARSRFCAACFDMFEGSLPFQALGPSLTQYKHCCV